MKVIKIGEIVNTRFYPAEGQPLPEYLRSKIIDRRAVFVSSYQDKYAVHDIPRRRAIS